MHVLVFEKFMCTPMQHKMRDYRVIKGPIALAAVPWCRITWLFVFGPLVASLCRTRYCFSLWCRFAALLQNIGSLVHRIAYMNKCPTGE